MRLPQPWSLLRYSILDRYLITQLFQTILFGLVLFTVVWLAPEVLFKIIQFSFAGLLPPDQAGLMFLYNLPPVLQQSIPMAVLLGGIFLFRRLSHQYELTAMLASGIHPARILWPVALLGFAFAALHFGIQELLTPNTSPRLEQLSYQYHFENRKDDNFVYVEKNRLGQLDKFFLIGQTSKEKLADFIILYYNVSPEGGVQISRILRAPTGQWNEHERAWQLFNGVDYELDGEGVYRETRRFSEQWVTTSKYPARLLAYSKVSPLNMAQRRLKEYVQLLKEGGQFQDVRFFEIRLFQKWAHPFASIVFAVLGALLGMERIRSQKNYGLTMGALVLFIYSILIPFSTNLGSLGLVPPLVSAWLPLSLTLMLSLGMVKLSESMRSS